MNHRIRLRFLSGPVLLVLLSFNGCDKERVPDVGTNSPTPVHSFLTPRECPEASEDIQRSIEAKLGGVEEGKVSNAKMLNGSIDPAFTIVAAEIEGSAFREERGAQPTPQSDPNFQAFGAWGYWQNDETRIYSLEPMARLWSDFPSDVTVFGDPRPPWPFTSEDVTVALNCVLHGNGSGQQ